jgi:prepilin-type N-terminal cleavage/methylation domain-containing protein
MRIEKKVYIFLKSKMGFTLIELMVALAIMSIVSAAIYGIFSLSSRSYTTQSVTADVQQSVRAAMEIMVQDIRAAGLDPTLSDNFGIELATATKLRFTSDSIDTGIGDFNGVVDDTNSERITYEFQANQLNQILYEGTVNENTQPLISDVQNSTFTCFDADGNDLGSPVPAANLADISAVEISMTVQEPAGRGDPVSRTLTKRIKCRNLELN